jgi:hypothetical protein
MGNITPAEPHPNLPPRMIERPGIKNQNKRSRQFYEYFFDYCCLHSLVDQAEPAGIIPAILHYFQLPPYYLYSATLMPAAPLSDFLCRTSISSPMSMLLDNSSSLNTEYLFQSRVLAWIKSPIGATSRTSVSEACWSAYEYYPQHS